MDIAYFLKNNPLVLAVYMPKGGAGKSFVARNLAEAYARSGKRVLVIDLDGTGSLTEGVGLVDVYKQAGSSIYDKLLYPKDVRTIDLIWDVPAGSFHAIPSEERMKKLPEQLVSVRNREYRLARAVDEIADRYDVVLTDCPPGDSVITDNAIVAARRLVMPVIPKDEHIRSVEQIFDQIERIRDDMQLSVEITAIVPNLYKRTKNQQRILDEFRRNLGALVTPFEIRERDVAAETFGAAKTVYNYDPPEHHKRQYLIDLQGYFDQLRDFISSRVEEVSV